MDESSLFETKRIQKEEADIESSTEISNTWIFPRLTSGMVTTGMPYVCDLLDSKLVTRTSCLQSRMNVVVYNGAQS